MDESSFAFNYSVTKVLGVVNETTQRQVQGGEKDNVTLAICFNANGDLMPPFIVHSGKLVRVLPEHQSLNVWRTATPSGWMTSVGMLEFCKRLAEHLIQKGLLTSNSNEQKVLLYMDGQSSHFSYSVLKFCKSAGIELVRNGSSDTDFTLKRNFPLAAAKIAEHLEGKRDLLQRSFQRTGLYPFNSAAPDYEHLLSVQRKKIDKSLNLQYDNDYWLDEIGDTCVYLDEASGEFVFQRNEHAQNEIFIDSAFENPAVSENESDETGLILDETTGLFIQTPLLTVAYNDPNEDVDELIRQEYRSSVLKEANNVPPLVAEKAAENLSKKLDQYKSKNKKGSTKKQLKYHATSDENIQNQDSGVVEEDWRDNKNGIILNNVQYSKKVAKRTRGRPTKTAATPQMNMAEEGDPDACQGAKSDLEMMRERNISMRKNMIKDIGLLDAKEAFEETLKKRQHSKGKEKVVDAALPVTRESRSLRRTEAAAAAAIESPANLPGETLPLNRCLASFSNLKDLQMFIETAQSVEKDVGIDLRDSELSSMEFPVMKSKLCTLFDTEFCLPEIASRFTSLAFHPSCSPLLLAGGNKNGCVCLWSVSREPKIPDNQLCAFQAHTDDVNHIQMGAAYPHFLYTSSSDGSVKCLDINKQQFTLCYKLPNSDESDAVLNWHALSGPSVLLAASSGGQLLRLDARDGSVAEFNCHTSSINTVDVSGGNLVLTASRDTFVSVWDVRYMNNRQGSGDGINSGRLKYVKLGVEAVSAFFSVGGSRLLVTTKERISVYDHAPNMDPFNTFSGTGNFIASSRSRELVPKAFWHPSRNDVLVVGGANGPVGGVHIFHAKHSSRPGIAVPANFVIKGACTSRVIFHPRVLALASCTASKVHVFN
ncbi:Hypothetical predicted protein [Cloeon dipterum]|uniref:WD repeat-containing protein 76 n=1 Tax=Cloeon dipterum TaxID=197152 RepID=A0A8S1DCD5_9INSE|nr:Hypothetical predicted protein [Cloeon dipterum]